MKKIFCVEDDFNIRELVKYTLESVGYEVSGFECGRDFFAAFENDVPDMAVLDIMLPDMDGLEILERLRKRYRDIPIIMLTAKTAQIDKIRGLNMGADDYITKPFDIMELVARVNALFRRLSEKNVIEYKNIVMNYEAREVSVDGKKVVLTYKEFEMLYYFLKNRGIVLSREKLMNEVWGIDFEGETRTVDVHIKTLRQKLGEAGVCIETIRNVGYKVN